MAKSLKTLKSEFSKLARQANDRLRALEKYSSDPRFPNILNWAYKNAMKDIKKSRGEGKNRFASPSSDRDVLKKQISDIKHFLKAPSSSISELQKMYRKRAIKINRKYGTEFTWEDMGSFFESAEYKQMAKDYGSKTAVKAVGKIQKKEEDIKEALENDDPIHIRIGNSEVKKAVNGILSEYGEEVFNLFN